MKIIVQRKVEAWVEDIYEVEEFNEDIKESILNYTYDPITTEVLWGTQEDLGPYEIFDKDYKTIEKGSY